MDETKECELSDADDDADDDDDIDVAIEWLHLK
jgi:hypothetical protein